MLRVGGGLAAIMAAVLQVGGWGIAAAAPSARQAGMLEAVLWMGVVILGLLLAVGVIAACRRHMLGSPRRGGGGMSLEQIRRWKDDGTVTAAEYEALRRRAVADLQRSLDDKR